MKNYISALLLFSVITVVVWKSDDILAVLNGIGTPASDPDLSHPLYTTHYDTTLAWLIHHEGIPSQADALLAQNGGTFLEKVLVDDYDYDPFYAPVVPEDSAGLGKRGIEDAIHFYYASHYGAGFMDSARAKAAALEGKYHPQQELDSAQASVDDPDIRNKHYYNNKTVIVLQHPTAQTFLQPDTLSYPGLLYEPWIAPSLPDKYKIEFTDNTPVRALIYWDTTQLSVPYSRYPIGWVIVRPKR